MSELIGFPDVEAAIIALLNAELATREPGVEAATRPPSSTSNPTGGEFITVLATGGPSETMVTNAPTVTIEAYAAEGNEARAYALCDLALAIIRSQDATIRGARGFSYPQNLPDPTTSQVRYTSTGEVRVWGAVTP